MTLTAFPCTQCGLCCRNVDLAEQTRYLDRGDGACQHYSDADKLCLIYENRPDICRVDTQYKAHYSQQYSWDEFTKANIQICQILQNHPPKNLPDENQQHAEEIDFSPPRLE